MKFEYIYVATWWALIILYSLHWSELNQPLSFGLLLFFLISGVVALVSGILKKPALFVGIEISHKSITATLLICVGFAASFVAAGGLPMTMQYSGYDTDLGFGQQETLGIPMVTPLVIAFAIFYSGYLAYLILSRSSHDRLWKQLIIEYSVIIFMFILNGSRGYITFSMLIFIFLYIYKNMSTISQLKAKLIPIALLVIALIVFLISVLGNIRSNCAWNDYSYIETIGVYTSLPFYVPKWVLWTYTYTTSSLSNLNYNILMNNSSSDIIAMFEFMLPESISKYMTHVLSVNQPIYNVEYLNASTGFVQFYNAFGLAGIYMGFFAQFAIYKLTRYILHRLGVLQSLGEVFLCFLTLVNIFYSSLSTVAVCYIPIFVILLAFYIRHKMSNTDTYMIDKYNNFN